MGRQERVGPRAVDDWRRPRSPGLEGRPAYLSREDAGQKSSATSRHCSPPVHASRLAALQQNAAEDRAPSSRASPRHSHDEREHFDATRKTDRDAMEGIEAPASSSARQEDTGLPVRAPPTGPGGQRAVSSAAPTAPAGVLSAPAGPRGSAAPPSGPRGAPSTRGDISSRARGGFSSEYSTRGRGSYSATFRGGRGGAPPSGPSRGDTYGQSSTAPSPTEPSRRSTESAEPIPASSRPPPSGPRNSYASPSQPPTAPAYRPSPGGVPTAPSFPRAQRFASANDVNAMSDIPTGPKLARLPTGPAATTSQYPRVHPAMQDLPRVVDGGLRAEPLTDRSKAARLEEEAEKIRKVIEEKDARKRKSLREWGRMTRETEMAALRSELAEEALRALNGEDLQQAAF